MTQRLTRRSVLAGSLLAAATAARGQEQPGAPVIHPVDPDRAYLFAHMTSEAYGRLFYSVSLDGYTWHRLNGGRMVSADYRGHASIAKGPDGRYHLVGNINDDDPSIRFWVSEDLIRWTPNGRWQPDLNAVEEHPHALQRIGAPKLMFDEASGRFLLTWHTPNVPGSPDDPERYWASQRTLYALAREVPDFAGPPRRLFGWDMATIDTIVLPNAEGGGYCAVVKDERYPSYTWPTGKTVRLCFAPALTGPYGPPGAPVSPNFREAPTLIRAPGGRDWLLYYEQYAGSSYGLSMAPRLEGPWVQVSGNSSVREWDRFVVPPRTRHGSMIGISRAEHDRIVAAFPA